MVREYLGPLDRLPQLQSPPASGRIGFGSANLRLRPLPALVVDEGYVGYKLYLTPRARSIHPNWRVATQLSRVNWHGFEVESIARTNRRVRTIKAGRGAGIRFELDGAPGPYRVITSIHNKADRRIAKYGFYFRLMPEVNDARLALTASSYRPEQIVFFRVENLGTGPVSYGVPYSIERREGTAWTEAPESPDGPWILPLLFSAPGQAGQCGGFWIPPTMPAGQYRVMKEVSLGSRSLHSHPTYLTAEFELSP